MSFESPALVAAGSEFDECCAELCDGREEAQPEELLFECSDEAFGTAVALGRPLAGWARGEALEAKLLLKILGSVDAAVVVAERDTLCDLLGGLAEEVGDGLLDRLERFESIAWLAGVQAEALACVVIGHDEDRRLTLARHRRRPICAPHLVWPSGDDLAVASSRATIGSGSRRRQKVRLTHHAQHTRFRRSDAMVAQLSPSFATAFAEPVSMVCQRNSKSGPL